jgi:hypothetical protein
VLTELKIYLLLKQSHQVFDHRCPTDINRDIPLVVPELTFFEVMALTP